MGRAPKEFFNLILIKLNLNIAEDQTRNGALCSAIECRQWTLSLLLLLHSFWMEAIAFSRGLECCGHVLSLVCFDLLSC